MLEEANSAEWPYSHECLTNDAGSRYGAPVAAVARLGVVVAHHEIVVRGDNDVANCRPQWIEVGPRLLEGLAVHVDGISL